MTRDKLRDPSPGDRFVLTVAANRFIPQSAGWECRCARRTPKTVTIFRPWEYRTMRLSTLAKIARPKGKS